MADVTDLTRAVSEQVQAIHEQALRLTLADTIDAAPIRTGLLRASTDVTGTAMVGDFVALGSIFSLVPYAGYTDAGTPPHPIDGNPLLYFFWEKLGRFVALPHVNHPGTAGTQWFNGGADDGEPMASRWEAACNAAAP